MAGGDGLASDIGLETARDLARQGATVVLACRSESRATTAGARSNFRAPQVLAPTGAMRSLGVSN